MPKPMTSVRNVGGLILVLEELFSGIVTVTAWVPAVVLPSAGLSIT